jgi:hypothetical protein
MDRLGEYSGAVVGHRGDGLRARVWRDRMCDRVVDRPAGEVRMRIVMIGLIACVGLVGCTTLFPPPAQQVLLQSQPAGATVSINGESRGSTPLSLPLTCQPVPLIRMELPGYRTVEHPMPRRDGGDGRMGYKWPAEKCEETLSIVLSPMGKEGR